MSSFFTGKDDSAVEELLSQAKDQYVLEQVAKINCSGFTDDTALPTNPETRLRRLKSLPVSRTDSVSSSPKKLLSHSNSMASHPEKKYRGNVSSVSSFSIQVGKSCPLDSSVEETQIFSKTKRNQSVKSRGGLGESSGSKRIGSSSSRFSCGNVSSTGSSSSRFSREGNISTATKTLKLPC
ncbi:F26F24.11 [Arabidopsis thaliana]|uniref:F26F24.11 n=3 Tax=Arabidopsis thaliana TaxID=3702 RepID=Q9LR35_ARATH|nr:uncharacterized protein AT1G23270 [Arabidopsis thaliana]AAF87018.1 F26F24.11 [Arabidopsis thaliana]AEE30366.1 hypothetical protein AT1G23270 [Arabidopsis thaliana]CAA0235598.1 unnamed protein product [Arabidopsis thaliana]VYS46982.1 unnamed protein product [Arabidopsis thaliana]|eukprot:NP_173741.1 hypothetical protein AT1G23270 [Arabidopsis thaliana]